MSNEGIPTRIADIKERADTKVEVLESAKNAFAETMRRFSFPIEMAFNVPELFDDAFVRHQTSEKTESIDELRDVAVAAAKTTLRLWRVDTPDVLKFFEEQLDSRLPGQNPADRR